MPPLSLGYWRTGVPPLNVLGRGADERALLNVLKPLSLSTISDSFTVNRTISTLSRYQYIRATLWIEIHVWPERNW